MHDSSTNQQKVAGGSLQDSKWTFLLRHYRRGSPRIMAVGLLLGRLNVLFPRLSRHAFFAPVLETLHDELIIFLFR
jgi:hypothetical protein